MRAWRVAFLLLVFSQTGCALFISDSPATPYAPPELTPAGDTLSDLLALPKPKGPITVSVYGFRDQTGQYRPSPASSFSTAVTQGAGSMLVKAALDSGWFIPVERENLQDLLTERKIVRANSEQRAAPVELPPLLASSLLLTGGIVAYETNVKTGGAGARYFGIGASELYRMDQVTVSLRAVDIRTGQILASVSTSKTIFSYQLDSGVFRFVKFKRLLELEAGFTRNEPAQLCVRDAIESALVHMIALGIKKELWQLENPADIKSPVISTYLREQELLTSAD